MRVSIAGKMANTRISRKGLGAAGGSKPRRWVTSQA